MPPAQLTYFAEPRLQRPVLLLGLTGWMDGGDVSTGTVEALAAGASAAPLAEIAGEDFYLYSFPGSMEISALFRPHVNIVDGLIEEMAFARGAFTYDAGAGAIYFLGKEPHLNWSGYAACLFDVIERFDVPRVVFVGSVAGAVPHTREPRMWCSVSRPSLRDELARYGVRFSDYEGPGSFITYLTREVGRRQRDMVAFVAEIPAYVQGTNPICIEAVCRRLAALTGLPVDLNPLRKRRAAFEKRLHEVVQQKPELVELIQKLESDYDNEVFDTEMTDLKQWLQQRGIRLD